MHSNLQKNSSENYLECEFEERLLRRILDHKAHWSNAEI